MNTRQDRGGPPTDTQASAIDATDSPPLEGWKQLAFDPEELKQLMQTLAAERAAAARHQDRGCDQVVLGRARSLLRQFGTVKLTDRTSFPPRRSLLLNRGHGAFLFLGSAEVYERYRPCLMIGAACGEPSAPVTSDEKVETRGDIRIVRRIETFSLTHGTPLKSWSITQFGECNSWYGFFDGFSIVEESRQAWLERLEAWRTKVLSSGRAVLPQTQPYEQRRMMAKRHSQGHFSTEWTRRFAAAIRDAHLTEVAPGRAT